VNKQTLAEHVIDSIVNSTLFNVTRSGFKLTVTGRHGDDVATIQFNDLPDMPRCVIRRAGHLIGQCHYSADRMWYIFPIERGQIAREPLQKDPLSFLKQVEDAQSPRVMRTAAAS